MSLITKVKAGSITNLSDARYCAGMGVDWIGFPAAEVSPTQFIEITGWLSGPQWVIELYEQPWPLPEQYPVTIWQCVVNDFELALDYPGSLMVLISIQQWPEVKQRLLANRNRIDCLVVFLFTDTMDVDKATLAEIQQYFSVLIDLKFTTYPLSEIITWPNAGINVHGSNEQKPGLKDYEQLADVLEKLESNN
ncbi:MAG: hypothetical protein KF763_00800 [Cyclobacteriaceae bacterium]|nr:hypothetical protein [Cyclobacteriaceae bacterium]